MSFVSNKIKFFVYYSVQFTNKTIIIGAKFHWGVWICSTCRLKAGFFSLILGSHMDFCLNRCHNFKSPLRLFRVDIAPSKQYDVLEYFAVVYSMFLWRKNLFYVFARGTVVLVQIFCILHVSAWSS